MCVCVCVCVIIHKQVHIYQFLYENYLFKYKICPNFVISRGTLYDQNGYHYVLFRQMHNAFYI